MGNGRVSLRILIAYMKSRPPRLNLRALKRKEKSHNFILIGKAKRKEGEKMIPQSWYNALFMLLATILLYVHSESDREWLWICLAVLVGVIGLALLIIFPGIVAIG